MPSLIEQAKELRVQRKKLFDDARALSDKAEKENRDFTQEEKNQYDTMLGDADKIKNRYERLENEARMAGELEQSQQQPLFTQVDTIDQVNRAADDVRAGRNPSILDAQVVNPVLHRYLGIAQQEQDQQRAYRAKRLYELYFPKWAAGDFRHLGGEELRALQMDLDTSGGYLRPPQQMVGEILKAVDDTTFIRSWARVFSGIPAGASLGVPTLDADPADSDWTSELATGSEDSTMAFGKRELKPYPLAKRIKVSKTLIRGVPTIENYVRQRLTYKTGITIEKAALTGSGAGQMLGVFTASSNGISTGRDVSTGNTDSAMTPDGLKNAKYNQKQQYWPRLRWLFHRDGQKMISKFKDNEGRYMWQESIRVGEPDTLLGFPAFMSEYAPNTFTTGLYVGILGDFSNYWIAESLALEFQVLLELYAETNQVGIILRTELDGQPVLEEAFTRVKLG